jgi:hypothetical protein
MDCHQAHSLLPLWVGQDLSGGELSDGGVVRQLEEHVGNCPACAARRQELVRSQQVLQDSRDGTVYPLRSVWPVVMSRLAAWDARPQYSVFNVWIPTLAAAAAALLLVTLAVAELRRTGPLGPSIPIADRGDQRNLFLSDPEFARGSEEFPSGPDLHHIVRRHQAVIQPARSRPRQPSRAAQSPHEW